MYLLLCLFSSAMAVLALSSWAAKQGSGFAVDELLVPAGSIAEELRTTAMAVSLVTLAMGNAAFLLYDRALHNMLMLYKVVWQPRLHKMLSVH